MPHAPPMMSATASGSQSVAYDTRLERLNDQATTLEDAFATNLGQASRIFRERLDFAVGIMTLLLVGVGVGASAFIARVLKRRDLAVVAGAVQYARSLWLGMIGPQRQPVRLMSPALVMA